jgi:hypothetical protein
MNGAVDSRVQGQIHVGATFIAGGVQTEGGVVCQE